MKIRHIQGLSAAALMGIIFTLNSYAGVEKQWINQKLQEFKSNPKAFINNQKNVSKYHPVTLQPLQIQPLFSQKSIETRDYVLQKDFIQASPKNIIGKAEALPNDKAENLVDELKYTTLQSMEEAGLLSKTLPEEKAPWSDDYWPIYTGVIAKRYADDNFPDSDRWRDNKKYIFEGNSCSIDDLSPAEKYDLLVGDSHRTLTRRMIDDGSQYANESGMVETWMGICHGWSPASFMIQRPTHKITVTAADEKTKINFYPSDIKALSSLLWAKAPPTGKLKIISGRCQIKNPAEDENGRILAQECFDTNPGTWHLVVVNQLGGKNPRSFVLDATYDYEVWNQPAYSYEYSYFNPQTLQAVDQLTDAKVPIENFTADKFSNYRSNKTASVVGIVMKFTYVAETNPTHSEKDSAANDRRVAVNYLYDLELDENDEIIGGEWYHRQHPDFLWLPQPDAHAVSIAEPFLNRNSDVHWDGVQPFPAVWTQYAKEASENSQPLARVVDTLVTLSRLSN